MTQPQSRTCSSSKPGTSSCWQTPSSDSHAEKNRMQPSHRTSGEQRQSSIAGHLTQTQKLSPKQGRDRDHLIYRRESRLFLKKKRSGGCEVCRIKRRKLDLHHVRGRAGALLNDRRYWMAVCRQCHNRIAREPRWARDHGYLCPIGQWNKPDRT